MKIYNLNRHFQTQHGMYTGLRKGTPIRLIGIVTRVLIDNITTTQKLSDAMFKIVETLE